MIARTLRHNVRALEGVIIYVVCNTLIFGFANAVVDSRTMMAPEISKVQ